VKLDDNTTEFDFINRLISPQSYALLGLLGILVIYLFLKIFYLDYFLYLVFCSCFKDDEERYINKLSVFDGILFLMIAISTIAFYKSYMYRVLQYKQLIDKNIQDNRGYNDYYIHNLKRDRTVLLNKLEKHAKINRRDFTNNFDETIERLMDHYNVIEENKLHYNFSYNIAHIPGYESYAV
jgi:hypothetical protein